MPPAGEMVRLQASARAGRNSQRLLPAGLLARQGRAPGVGRRRDPQIHHRRQRRLRRASGQVEGAAKARAQVAAGMDHRHHQDQQQSGPQRPRVAARQVRARRPQAQPIKAGHQALAMHAAQSRLVAGSREIRRQLIVQRPQGLVRDAAVPLEPRQPGIARGRHQRPACTPEGQAERRREQPVSRTRCSTGGRTSHRPNSETAAKMPSDRQGRPERRPHPFDRHHQPGQPYSKLEAVRLSRVAGTHDCLQLPVGALPEPVGICSSANWRSISKLGRITANRSPSTSTSAALGREL